MARLDRDLEVVVVETLEQANLLERRLDERLRLVALSQVREVFRQRARVGPDPHRHAGGFRRTNDLRHLVRPADVAGIDPDGSDSGVDRAQGEARVEVNVRDHRDRRQPDELGQSVGVLALGHGDAHDLAARGGERGNLRGRRLDVVGLRQRHRLDDDRGAAADLHAAHVDRAFTRHRR